MPLTVIDEFRQLPRMTVDETQSSRDPRQDLKGPALGYPTHTPHMHTHTVLSRYRSIRLVSSSHVSHQSPSACALRPGRSPAPRASRLFSWRIRRFTRLASREPSDLPSSHPAVRPMSCHVCVAGAAKGEAATTEEATATDCRKERELESDEAALSRL